MKIKKLSLFSVIAMLLVSVTGYAQNPAVTQYVPDTSEVAVAAPENMDEIDGRRGLDGVLSVSANVNLVQNSSVVGQVDGFSTVFGLGLTGGLDWLYGRHELRNTLVIDESFARTPVLERFVKNSDSLNFSSQYNYFFLDWMGAFGRLSFQTSLFPNYDYRSEPTKYKIKKLDGKEESVTSSDLEISGAFSPISLQQSVGVLADPLRTDPISLTTRLGIGGRESFSKGVISVGKKDAQGVYAAEELDNVYQFGAEAFVGGNGKFYEGRLTYDFGVSVLIPFVNNDPKNRGAFELTRVGVGGSINFAVFSWMGLNYKLFMLRDPQLVDKIQLQNSLLVTFNYTFIERAKEIKADPAVLEAERAEAEKKAAEQRAKEMEEKAAKERAAAAEAAVQPASKPAATPPAAPQGTAGDAAAPEGAELGTPESPAEAAAE